MEPTASQPWESALMKFSPEPRSGDVGSLLTRAEVRPAAGRSVSTPSPVPPPLVKARVAVHPLPQGGEGMISRARTALAGTNRRGGRHRFLPPKCTNSSHGREKV
jgi:hypothetical protein